MLQGLLLAGFFAALSPSGDLSRSVPRTYERVSPAVVGITCRVGGRESYIGTGTLIDPAGLILTSVTVVPEGASRIQVYMTGGKVIPAKSLLVEASKELSLLRLELPEGHAPLPFLKLGDSSEVRIGDVALTLGNAFQSIEADDQVTLGEGLVSGLYHLRSTLSESKYAGPAIETSAHLNNGMDGGPLVDSSGDLIGVLCLNYSRSRWLGTAVPINELKPFIAAWRGWHSDRDEDLPAYAGVELEEVGGAEVRVLRVYEGGPAAASGLTSGDRITKVGDKVVKSFAVVKEALKRARPGETLTLETLRDGAARKVELTFWGNY